MPRPKGIPKTGGKQKGTLNKRTIEWEEFGRDLTTHGMARAKQIMDEAEDDKFMNYMAQMLNYFRPKQSTSDVKQTTGLSGIINLEVTLEQKDILDGKT